MKNMNIIPTMVLMLFFLGCSKEYDPIYLKETPTLEGHAAKAGPGSPIGPTRPQPRLYFPENPVTELAPFGKISGHTTTVFDNKLWIIFDKQVWRSADGVNWTKYSDLPFQAHGHSTIVFNNKLWVLDGSLTASPGSIWRLDVEKGSKGWKRVLKAPPFPARRDQRTVVFDNKVWIIGGYSRAAGRSLRDVWNSSDGIRWTRVIESAPFSERWGHTATVFDDKIWIIGGTLGGIPGDVWQSSNGVDWVKESHGFNIRIHHEAAVFDDKLWIIGGLETSLSSYVWNMYRKPTLRPWYWRNISKYYDINFHQRTGHTATTFKNKLWIIGGHEVVHEIAGSELKGDVWAIEMR